MDQGLLAVRRLQDPNAFNKVMAPQALSQEHRWVAPRVCWA
jgi:hypothetical protein